jgi:hypothetical protein
LPRWRGHRWLTPFAALRTSFALTYAVQTWDRRKSGGKFPEVKQKLWSDTASSISRLSTRLMRSLTDVPYL